MFHGLLIKESLKDQGILSSLAVTKEDRWDVDNATEGQPSVWNVAWFDVPDENIDTVAQALSAALHSGQWYLDLSSDAEKVVVFPGKVFRYTKGDMRGRTAAQQFGYEIGIPEDQLDWKE